VCCTLSGSMPHGRCVVVPVSHALLFSLCHRSSFLSVLPLRRRTPFARCSSRPRTRWRRKSSWTRTCSARTCLPRVSALFPVAFFFRRFFFPFALLTAYHAQRYTL
jgi:hypothetical protein